MQLASKITTAPISAGVAVYRRRGFKSFVNEIFSLSFKDERGFVGGKYIDDCCDRLTDNQHTIEITARDHFKSTRIYAYLMYRIMTSERDIEVQYFSYNNQMSQYHLVKLKTLLYSNSIFQRMIREGSLIDLVPSAKVLVEYRNVFGAKITIHPRGMQSFARGIHADIIIIDDPFPDVQEHSKASPTEVKNVNHIVRASIFSMVKKSGSIHIVGTPQTNHDFFFDEALTRQFKVSIKPAVINDKTQRVLWPQWMSYDDLMKKRNDIGANLFAQEYLASPAYVENSFLDPELLRAAIDADLKQAFNYNGEENVVAGFDIGKKAHPSHIAIFEEKNGNFKQLYSGWLDKWNYIDQVNLIEELIDRYKIDTIYYDATRGELETLAEQGKLPPQMEPVHFTTKRRQAMATALDAALTTGSIRLLNDERQRTQLLAVNNDLQAIESPEGHADSFWSVALGVGNPAKVIQAFVLK